MEKAIIVCGREMNKKKEIEELNRFLANGWCVKFALTYNDGQDVLVIIHQPIVN